MKVTAHSFQVDHPKGRFHLRRIGEGPHLILALHGFGLSGAMFTSLAKLLDPHHFSCLAIDLPGHGQTNWQPPVFYPADISELLEELQHLASWSSIQLLGFSLGGRVWSKLVAQGLCPRANSLTLVAPDGYGGRYTSWIDGRLGHLLSPVSHLGNHPRPWTWMARQLEKRKVISPFARHFVESQLNDPGSRQRLQLTLRSLGQFRLDKRDYSSLAQWGHKYPAEVWIGQKDAIIRSDRLTKLLAPYPSIKIETYANGHQLPLEALSKKLRQ